MQNVATPDELTGTRHVFRQSFPLGIVSGVLFLAALWFGLCRELSGEWSVNEQYNFGWFVPFFALYLFWLRWQDRPGVQIPSSKTQVAKSAATLAIASIALLLLLPIRLFEIANPEWRLLAWGHTLAVVTLTYLFLWRAGGKSWLRHFAFPVAFIFIAVPWPTAVETPVIQGLMRAVARVAAETAMLLGTPAQVEGNLIRVTNGLVGVNEACSGIRSLQTSLMIGLLFGELKRLSVLRRVALVACAVAIALLANFVRAVFLVRVAATEDLYGVGRWHDISGYSIIVLVFLATMGLAYLLGRSQTRGRKSELSLQSRQSATPTLGREHAKNFGVGIRQSAIPISYMAAALCWLLLVEIGTASWYRTHETNLVSGTPWSVQWPEQDPNFRRLHIDPEIRSVLRFDEGHAAAWTISSPSTAETAHSSVATATSINGSRPIKITCHLYVFRWEPGKNSALLANLHRPDVCLPASGWKQVADYGVRRYPVSGSFELPFRHFEFQHRFEDSPRQTAHAFYCLSEDRAAGTSAPPRDADLPSMSGNRSEWTRAERLRAVLEGRRHLGQQVIEAIFFSSEPFSSTDAESHLGDLVRDVIVSGDARNR